MQTDTCSSTTRSAGFWKPFFFFFTPACFSGINGAENGQAMFPCFCSSFLLESQALRTPAMGDRARLQVYLTRHGSGSVVRSVAKIDARKPPPMISFFAERAAEVIVSILVLRRSHLKQFISSLTARPCRGIGFFATVSVSGSIAQRLCQKPNSSLSPCSCSGRQFQCQALMGSRRSANLSPSPARARLEELFWDSCQNSRTQEPFKHPQNSRAMAIHSNGALFHDLARFTKHEGG